jgi:hypothetical protein
MSMRLIHNIDENSGEFDIQLVSENQQESALLVEIGNRLKPPCRSYGRIDRDGTWLWLHLPIKKAGAQWRTFGNDIKRT